MEKNGNELCVNFSFEKCVHCTSACIQIGSLAFDQTTALMLEIPRKM